MGGCRRVKGHLPEVEEEEEEGVEVVVVVSDTPVEPPKGNAPDQRGRMMQI